MAHSGGLKAAACDIEAHHFGIIDGLDAEARRRPMKGVQHGAASAQEEGVGAAKAQRPAERRLEANALFSDPAQHVLGGGDHHPRQGLVGVPLGDA